MGLLHPASLCREWMEVMQVSLLGCLWLQRPTSLHSMKWLEFRRSSQLLQVEGYRIEGDILQVGGIHMRTIHTNQEIRIQLEFDFEWYLFGVKQTSDRILIPSYCKNQSIHTLPITRLKRLVFAAVLWLHDRWLKCIILTPTLNIAIRGPIFKGSRSI